MVDCAAQTPPESTPSAMINMPAVRIERVIANMWHLAVIDETEAWASA